jgi:hypothetical protein
MVAANPSNRYEQSRARQYHGEAAPANCKRLQKTILRSQTRALLKGLWPCVTHTAERFTLGQ